LRRRRSPKYQRKRVSLALVLQQRNQSRRFSDRDGKHSGSLRVKRPEMPGRNLTVTAGDRIDSAHARDGACRRRPRALEEIDETDHVSNDGGVSLQTFGDQRRFDVLDRVAERAAVR
jgi:hypothetical protein